MSIPTPDGYSIHNIPFVNFEDAYWFIGEDENSVFSSKHRKRVSVGDPEFIEWSKVHAPMRTKDIDMMQALLKSLGIGDVDSEHHDAK